MISVVQNFICTKQKRLELLEFEMPNMGKVFKDYEFFVNYNSEHYLKEVYEIYKNNISKLNFYNNLEYNWGLVTLSMIEEVKTPYTMVLCEDFEYRITYNEWNEMIDEFVERDVGYMPIGRLWKYTREEYWSGYEPGKKLWLYPASKSPGSSLSVDAIYKTELLKEKLIELVDYKSRRFPVHLPHHYEDIFHEPNGVTKWGDDILCAVPKEIILMHKQEETETHLNK
tara:strand:+ start:808 stop:1488 length:681 start_codon:yes stop_codon:yes gene_type:complete